MQKVAAGVYHRVPKDVRDALQSHKNILEHWNSLTPVARNEWICWVTIVKKEETRKAHLKRMKEELLEGKKRPCCWPGCPHRNPATKKWFGKK
jgi:uncharacterized protein YdeI (YjbR/CyaY-like superfamily)